MVTRGRAWLAPPLLAVAIGVGYAAGPGGIGAADPLWDPPPCSPGGGPVGGPGGDPADAPGRAWFRMDALIGPAGELAGYDLEVGRTGATPRRMELAPEAFASAPRDGRIVVGTDDGRRSTIRIVDTAAGCVIDAGERRDVVRSAILAHDGSLIEHRVDRRTRADLGVWRLDLEGGDETALLPGLGPDPDGGPTFATLLLPGVDGRIAVASCGEGGCRTRVVDPATGVAGEIIRSGEPIGFGSTGLVAYTPCPGLPCAVEHIDVETGVRTTLAETAGLATLTEGGSVLVLEAGDRGRRLEAVDIGSGRRRTLGDAPGALRLHPNAARAHAALETRAGEVVLAADGRFGRGAPGSLLVDAVTGQQTAVEEIR